ncbi:MAG TPA: low molecular weight protein-tyrosine-phosphatase [Luteibaculaceae bacterium]|nr:low molecular weight protein-tyrosine-phosphatase [Luteibaculaceae bacterium]
MKVLMVCLGNICRSPLAEGVMRHLAAEKGLEVQVDSCGTADYHVGDTPDPRAIKVAANHGIDISQHLGRQFSAADFKQFDRIFAMDTQNYKDIIAMAPTREDIDKVQLMMSAVYPKEKINVPDPYYRDFDAFEEVYQMLHTACTLFLTKVPVNEG